MTAGLRPEASCGDGCGVVAREVLAEGSGGSVIATTACAVLAEERRRASKRLRLL